MQEPALGDVAYGTDLEWQRTFDAVPDLIAILDNEFRIVRLNSAMARALGSPAEQIVGGTCYECMHLSKRPPENCPHAALLADGKEHVAEVFEPKLNATLLVSVSPIFDHAGSVVGSIHVARDITARVEAEKALLEARDELDRRVRERTAELARANRDLEKEIADRQRAERDLRNREQFFSHIFESIQDGITVLDKDLTILQTNATMERWYAYAMPLPGKKCYEAYHHADGPCKTCPTLRTLQTGETTRADVPRIGAVGRIEGWLELYAFPLTDPASGRISGVIEYFRDITDHKRAEEALRSASAYHRSLIEASLDPLVTISAAGKITDVNSATERVTGRSRQELIGTDFADYFTDSEKARAGCVQAFEEGSVRDYELEIRHMNGNLTPVTYNASVYRDSSGVVIGLFAAARDITDRQDSEKALRAASSYHRSLIEVSVDPLVTISAEGKITDANTATEKVTGYERDELIGTDFSDYFTEPRKARAGYRQVFSRGWVRDYELEIRHRSGSVTPVTYNASVYHDESGEVAGVFAAARDISARKRADEAVAKRNRDIEAILNATDDSALLLSSEGTLLALNSAAAHRFGKTIDEMMGKHIADFLPPEVRAYRMARLDEAMATRSLVRFEDELGGRHYATSYYPIIGPARKVEGVAVFASDVTDRKTWEEERERLISELEAKNAELERFTYSVSHDLKSPLITIKSFVGFIEEEVASGTTENLQSDLGRIGNAADKMGQLLDEILELSRVGRVFNPPTEVPMTDVANEVLELLSGTIIERAVEVTLAPDLPVLYGDRPRLREVFQNLIENAVKFMGDQPRPTIEIGSREEGGETILYVRDNGIGIDVPHQGRIFRLFDKLDDKTEGTGIGLALVKRIVELHGGRIWVESKGIGTGCTFCFKFPLAAQGGERPRP